MIHVSDVSDGSDLIETSDAIHVSEVSEGAII
jgi:hypothetical protein